jgi:phage terminase large subunit-like protein
VKEHKDSTRRIDLAVAAVMAFAAASTAASGLQMWEFDE